MVKLSAPCLSLAASGKLGGALVFSSWKGRPYARELVTPANPQSASQTGVRAMFKFLSQAWTNISSGRQASWQTRADQLVASPFNAFMGYNQSRWRNFLSPSQVHPAATAESTANFINEAATAGVRQITLGGTIDGAGSHWGLLIFRALATPVVPSFSNLIAAIQTPLHQNYFYVDTPLAADQYFYNFRLFSWEGYMGANETEVNATVT